MRKRLFLYIGLLALFASCEKYNDVIVEEQFDERFIEERSWFEYLCSSELGGRYSGSSGIKATVDYITEIIGMSDSLFVDSFPARDCTMRNIVFHVDGDIKDTIIAIGAHYDAAGFKNKMVLPGANDNLSGVAVLLKVIKALQKDKIRPKYGIDICLFDGEEIGKYGSKRYIKECKRAKKHIKEYVNVDTCGDPNLGLVFFYSSDCSYLQDGFTDLINSIYMSVGEYDPIGFTTDCDSFIKYGTPFVCIVCKRLPNYLHKTTDNLSHISFSRLDILSKGLLSFIQEL